MTNVEATTDGATPDAGPPDTTKSLSYYGLRSAPFRAGADPDLLWLGKRQRAVLATLIAAIRDGSGIFVVTSGIGTGRTSLIHGLVEALKDEELLIGRVRHPRSAIPEFVQAVADAYRLRGAFQTNDVFVTRLQQLLAGDGASHKKVLLIVEEAQSLSPELLREIRDLSIIGTAQGRSLAILLVGQNDLSGTLAKDGQAALRQRITLRCTLDPLTPHEVGEYIGHCLKAAGATEEIFTPEAMREIALLSRGTPALINKICARALLTGYARQARTIGRDIIEACSASLPPPSRVTASAARNGRAWPPAHSRAVHVSARKPIGGRAEVEKGALRRLVLSRTMLYVGLPAAMVLLAVGYVLYAGWLTRDHESTAAASREPLISPPGLHDPAGTETPATLEGTGVTASRPESPTPPVPLVPPPPPADTSNTPPERPPREPARPPAPKAKASTAGQDAESVKSTASSRSPDTNAASTPAGTDGNALPRASRAPIRSDRESDRESDSSDPAAIIDWLLKEGVSGRR